MSRICVTMTTFVDFVAARSGTPKLTAVKQAKAQYQAQYDPATDFYKPLRECIVDAAQRNLSGTESLNKIHSVLVNLNTRKLDSYQECGEGYKRWRGRKNIIWDNNFRSEGSEWTQDRLTIRINPELGLLINGKRHIVKLYFKSTELSQFRLETTYYLLKQYHHKMHDELNVGVLDLRRGQLRGPNREIAGIEYLLAGEAAAFQTMWDLV